MHTKINVCMPKKIIHECLILPPKNNTKKYKRKIIMYTKKYKKVERKGKIEMKYKSKGNKK
jgi:hypothetical protein